MKEPHGRIYQELVQPCLTQAWVRARARRTLSRLAMYQTNPRHRLNLKTYHRIRIQSKVRTRSRDLVILPFMVGKQVSVHGGKSYRPLTITPEQVGSYLGEYVPTRPVVHKHTSKTRSKDPKR